MAKMTSTEKNIRKNLRAQLRKQGGELFTFESYGVTVAIRPSIPGGNARFYQVSVSTCSGNDKFKRKVGELVALEYLLTYGRFISVRAPDLCDNPMEYLALAVAYSGLFSG